MLKIWSTFFHLAHASKVTKITFYFHQNLPSQRAFHIHLPLSIRIYFRYQAKVLDLVYQIRIYSHPNLYWSFLVGLHNHLDAELPRTQKASDIDIQDNKVGRFKRAKITHSNSSFLSYRPTSTVGFHVTKYFKIPKSCST